MRPALRTGLLAVATGVLVAAPAQAAPPNIYHVIRSETAYAVVDRTEGCEHVVAYVSASNGQYAAQPGPVDKQGLTGVLVVVTDACAVTGVAAAAAPGPAEPVLARFEGRADVGPTVDPRLRSAHLDAVVRDVDDPSRTLRVTAAWTGAGTLEHDTGHAHTLFPGDGVVNSAGNDLRRTAVATVSLHAAGVVHLDDASTEDAVLERTRSHCIEVPRPGVEEFWPCFGFPG